MTLPIDIVGSVWLIAREVWEWEIDPAPPPDTADSDTLSSWPTACDPSRGPEWRLVFKGYEYEHSYLWSAADSPLSRPWLHQEPRDDEPDARKLQGPSPLDAAAKTPDDGETSS